MRKLFSLITLVLLLASCGGSKSYTISGNIDIDNIKDGDTISLGYSVDGTEFTPETFAVVKDGKFEFTGDVEDCKLYYLVNKATEEPLAIVFLEGGNIAAELSNDKCLISGTSSNDIYTTLQEELTVQVAKLQENQMKLYLDTTLTDEQREVIQKELQTISEQAQEVATKFIKENIKTMPALFMLVQCANMFNNEELDALVAEIPEENKNADNNCLFSVLEDIQEQRNNPQDFSDYFKQVEENTDTTATEKNEEK